MKARKAPTKKATVTMPLTARMDFYTKMARARIFSGSALKVAHALLYLHLNGRTGRCDPSIAALVEETGLTMRSVKRAISELRESGWWRVSREGAPARGGRTNAYAPRFELVKRRSPLGLESGEACDTSSTIKVVTLRRKRGDKVGTKVVTNVSPGTSKEPVRRLSRSISSIQRVDVHNNFVEQFEDFWRAYPSRAPHANPKAPARKKFAAAIKRGADPADIVRAAEAYAAAAHATRTDPRFVAQALTWLSQERWTDQQAPAVLPLPVAGMI
jgi:hypothetical protein